MSALRGTEKPVSESESEPTGIRKPFVNERATAAIGPRQQFAIEPATALIVARLKLVNEPVIEVIVVMPEKQGEGCKATFASKPDSAAIALPRKLPPRAREFARSSRR